MPSRWQSLDTDYRRVWGGRSWCVRVDGPGVGLRDEAARLGPILGLGGLSDRGRTVADVSRAASLIGHEARFDRVEAVYAPEGWPSLRIRAAWSSRGEDVIDLEVQAQALTVGDVESLEVGVVSEWPGDSAPPEEMAPRDGAFPPLLADFRGARRGLPFYLEMIHPDDALRREVDRASGTIRYALFGHDLERGVIVRGRLRGTWLAARPDEAEVARRLDEFLREPPPLGT